MIDSQRDHALGFGRGLNFINLDNHMQNRYELSVDISGAVYHIRFALANRFTCSDHYRVLKNKAF
jgi:hypothetical protein